MKRVLLLVPTVLLFSMAEPVKPSKDLMVEVIDREGIEHNLRGMVCNGKDYLRVKEGNLDYTIPFDMIKHISLLTQNGGLLILQIEFVNNRKENVSINANTYCTSIWEFGKVGFYMRDIKDIFIKKEK
ncbi:MAG: hypothetical protein ACK4SM_01240 [Aquificaceae bacterium]